MKVTSMEELRKQAEPIINIPNFSNDGYIQVRVRKPRLVALAAKGEIPNHLMGIAREMITGTKSNPNEVPTDETLLKRTAKITELYCSVTLIEPSYEEFKDIITDQQADEIVKWALSGIQELNSFRKKQKNGTNNNNG